MATNVFKPAREQTDSELRHSTLGSIFVGHMDKIINNKRASVVWEALEENSQLTFCCDSSPQGGKVSKFFERFLRFEGFKVLLTAVPHTIFICQVDVQTSPATIKVLKPKVFLTCSIRLPSQTWCNLSV